MRQPSWSQACARTVVRLIIGVMPSERKTTLQKGYDANYVRLRKQWSSVVSAGEAICSEAVCLEASRWIAPGSDWHLAHSPDRARILGPAHARCNLSEAGK